MTPPGPPHRRSQYAVAAIREFGGSEVFCITRRLEDGERAGAPFVLAIDDATEAALEHQVGLHAVPESQDRRGRAGRSHCRGGPPGRVAGRRGGWLAPRPAGSRYNDPEGGGRRPRRSSTGGRSDVRRHAPVPADPTCGGEATPVVAVLGARLTRPCT